MVDADVLPYFDLSGVPGVEELPRVLEANSRPIDIARGVPIAGFVSYRLYVSFEYHSQPLQLAQMTKYYIIIFALFSLLF